MNKFLKNKSMTNIVSLGLSVLVSVILLLGLFFISSFSQLSQMIFVIINVAFLIIILILNVLVLKEIQSVKQKYFKVIAIYSIVALIIGGGFTFVASSLNSAVGNIVEGSDEIVETVEFAVAINTEESKNITELSDIDGETVGIVRASLSQEIYDATVDEMNSANIDVKFEEYNGYQDIIIALVKGEIGAAVLPINYKYMFASEDADNDYMESLETIDEFKREIKFENSVGADIDVATEPFNVLVIGMDEQHSDVMMLATFNPLAFEITYTSISRDSFVPICGSSPQKLGHSRSYGRTCTIESIEELMDVEIEYYFEANFAGVVDMVDAIGGIPIDSPITFVGQTPSYDRGTYTVKVFEGLHMLDGEQALAFARERYAFEGGDFQRQLNQQQVISSFLNQLLALKDPTAALNVLSAAGDNVRTNIPVDMMVDLFNLVLTKIDRSYSQDFSAIDINSTRVTGYSSNQYDEGLELILWIYRLFEGSIEENREFILDNTDLMNTKISDIEPIKWSVNWAYSAPVLYNEWFNEKQVHDPIPDLVGKWTGKNLSELSVWAKERGITLDVNEIKEGDAKFDANLGNGYILSQDMPSGRLTSKVSVLKVDVITILPKVPDFTNMTLKEIQEIDWLNDYGFKVTVKYMKSHDSAGKANPDYVSGKVGQIASQSIEANTESDGSFSNVDIYIYDTPYVTETTPKATDSLDTIKAWAEKYLVESTTPIVYEEKTTINKNEDNKVASVIALKGDEPFLKVNGQLQVTLYKYQEVIVPDFINKAPSELINWLAQYGKTATRTESTTNCTGTSEVILSVSGITANTAFDPNSNVSYTVCKLGPSVEDTRASALAEIAAFDLSAKTQEVVAQIDAAKATITSATTVDAINTALASAKAAYNS